jgi:hypothetical protein
MNPKAGRNRDTGSIIMKCFANEWTHISLDDSAMDIH